MIPRTASGQSREARRREVGCVERGEKRTDSKFGNKLQQTIERCERESQRAWRPSHGPRNAENQDAEQ
eukprot:10034159-Alexandrium_andersonii.AAC.1